MAQIDSELRPFAYINGRYFYNKGGHYLSTYIPFDNFPVKTKIKVEVKRIGKTKRDKIKKFHKNK